MKTAGIVIILLLTVRVGTAQKDIRQIDSLVNLVNTQTGQDRLMTLIHLSEAYREISIDKSIETGEKAEQYANESGLDDMKGTILLSLGKSASISSDYPLALSYLAKAAKAFEESKNTEDLLKTHISTAIIYKNLADYEKADLVFRKAIDLAKENKLQLQQANAETNRGNMFFALGHYSKAMDSYQSAKSLYDAIQDTSRLAIALTNIGLVYWQWNKNTLALDMLLKAKEIYEKENNMVELGKAYNNIGKIYYSDIKDTSLALTYFEKSLSIREELGNQLGIAIVLANIGNIYRDRKQFDKAFELYTRSRYISKAIGYKEGLLLVNYYTALAHQKNRQFMQSNILLDSCLSMAKSLGIDSYNSLVNEAKLTNHAALGNYDAFIAEFKIFSAGRDSLKKELDNLKYAELEVRNELKVKKQALEDANRVQRQLQQRLATQRSVLIFLIMIAFGALTALIASRKK